LLLSLLFQVDGVKPLWRKKNYWTIKDILFELGYDAEDELGLQMLDEMFYRMDSEHPRPTMSEARELEAMNKRTMSKKPHFFTLCELELLLGVVRNNRFRGFFHMVPKDATGDIDTRASQEKGYESFRNLPLFPNNAENYVHDRTVNSQVGVSGQPNKPESLGLFSSKKKQKWKSRMPCSMLYACVFAFNDASCCKICSLLWTTMATSAWTLKSSVC
jgi:hypothetical protein